MTAQQAAGRWATLASIAPTAFDPGQFGRDLLARATAEATDLTGDPERDVSEWRLSLEEGEAFGQLVGVSATGVFRVWLCFAAEEGDGLEVMIAATKGATEASAELFGQSGTGIGNRLHVARMLDLGVACAIANGACFVRNDPHDDRVRAIYKAMGFEDGEILDLTNQVRIGSVCRFVDQVYELHGPQMPAFTRPW